MNKKQVYEMQQNYRDLGYQNFKGAINEENKATNKFNKKV